MQLNYEALVKDYLENLHVNLRNFKQGPDFLDTWVHDENHTTSLLGIFESAVDGGVKHLEVSVGAGIFGEVDLGYLTKELSRHGALAVKSDGPGKTLVFDRNGSTS